MHRLCLVVRQDALCAKLTGFVVQLTPARCLVEYKVRLRVRPGL